MWSAGSGGTPGKWSGERPISRKLAAVREWRSGKPRRTERTPAPEVKK
ncbi:putative UDP-glycosyltransferase 88B1 [Iris pallida]|uniref:UDP-glycosyltransferase 88B1 n=1 Tax=Iris pallida TaxID=29817 RepID=A0AAX6ETU2_IRIPA|nr:putative UDP-glycosyltransferase 88B1 [Iris pallida]KAJ6824020.1 putative UDP-glycosyltransferase 88B1 [Iris pallida]